jgi:hypothetical protein
MSGGFSVGRALDTGDMGAGQTGREAGEGDELAKYGEAVWIEPENGGGDCETRGAASVCAIVSD